MEFLLTIGVLLLAFWAIRGVIRWFSGGGEDVDSPRAQQPYAAPPPFTPPEPDVQRRQGARESDTFRPRPARSAAGPRVTFRDSARADGDRSAWDTDDLVDALTGRPLRRGANLYQCRQCKVFYESHSYDLIRTESGGRCVSCLGAEITRVTEPSRQRGRDAFVNVVTLQNYRDYVGHVITFEGMVHRVYSSQRRTDFAVMFEDKAWSAGFKMVVFGRHLVAVGGGDYLESLAGRTVRVRGLLVRDPTFGYEIVVNDRSLILSVR